MNAELDDDRTETAPGEIVHWMQTRPLALPGGLSSTAVGAFALGAVTAVAVLALSRWLGAFRR